MWEELNLATSIIKSSKMDVEIKQKHNTKFLIEFQVFCLIQGQTWRHIPDPSGRDNHWHFNFNIMNILFSPLFLHV